MACSPRRCLGTLLSPGPFFHSRLVNTSFPLVMSSPSWSCLMSCITPCIRYPAGTRLENVDSSHSSLPAGFRWSHCENCVVRIDLVRLVLVDDDAFFLMIMLSFGSPPWSSSHVADLPLLHTVLNSWNSVFRLKLLLFSSFILAFSVWSILFWYWLCFGFWVLRFFGIAGFLSMHLFNLLLRAHALQDSSTVRILFFGSAVLPLRLESRFYSSTSRFLASTHLLSLKLLAASHELRLIAVCSKLRLHIVPFSASQWCPLTHWLVAESLAQSQKRSAFNPSCATPRISRYKRRCHCTTRLAFHVTASAMATEVRCEWESLFNLSLCLLGRHNYFSMPPPTPSFQSSLWPSRPLWTCAIPPVVSLRCCLLLLNVCSLPFSFL